MNTFGIGQSAITVPQIRGLMSIPEVKAVRLYRNGTIVKANVPSDRIAKFRQTLNNLFSGKTILWLDGWAE